MFPRFRAIWVAGVVLAAVSLAAVPQASKPRSGWVKVFNGKDLEGWEVVGTGGKWGVEDGMIVARREPPDRGASWLVSRRDFGDFILRLKFNPGAEIYNSGILVRDPGHTKIYRPAYNGFEVILAQGQKDENANGAIYYVASAYVRPIHASDWVDVEVRCTGDHIVTLINGKKMAETHTRRSYKGAIGFHLHGGEEAANYRFKDIEIRELPSGPRPFQLDEERLEQAPGEFQPLSSGPLEQDFVAGGNAWSLENQILRASNAAEETDIFTKQSYSNFELSFDFQLQGKGDAGVLFRAPAGQGNDRGYEFHIEDPAADNPPGSIFNLARAFMHDPNLQTIYHPGAWHRGRIYATGNHLITYVNLLKTAEVHADRSARGRIGFRAGKGSTVQFRNVRIKTIG